MPARSRKQQNLMAMALHSPSKVKSKNKGVLKMTKTALREFASTLTKGLPRKKKAPKKQTMEQFMSARNKKNRSKLW